MKYFGWIYFICLTVVGIFLGICLYDPIMGNLVWCLIFGLGLVFTFGGLLWLAVFREEL